MIFHKKQLDTDISTIMTYWNTKKYYQSSKAAADILTVSIGSVPQPTNALFYRDGLQTIVTIFDCIMIIVTFQ